MGVTTALLTVEQYMELPEEETMRTELVEGEIVRMGHSGYLHERTKSNATQILHRYVLDNPIGVVFSESMYKLGKREGRIPDVSFVLGRRLPNGWTFGLPNAVYRTAEGIAFDVRGIPPEIEVPVFADADVASGKDPGMAKAIQILSDGASAR